MAPIIHGHTRRIGKGRVSSPEYRAYAAMKTRCLNKRQDRYKDYGGRGITICDRWLRGEGGLSGFECFLHDLGPKPSAQHSVERVDNDKGYSPDNVKWATRVEQARNSRNARIVDVVGVPMTFAEAVERWGAVSNETARVRLHRGWSVHDAIFVPLRGKPGDADCDLWPGASA